MGRNIAVQWLVEVLTGQTLGRQSQFSIYMAEQARAEQVDGELRLTFIKGNVDVHFAPRGRAA